MATEAAPSSAQGPKLKIAKVVEGDIMSLRLIGTIDEDFDGAALAETVKGTVILDLGEVKRISSFGIREWVDFIKAAEDRAHAIYFIECSPKIIDQFNMWRTSAARGRSSLSTHPTAVTTAMMTADASSRWMRATISSRA